MEEEYTPISCSFYDRLEAAATLQKEVEVAYYSNGQTQSIRTIIKTFMIRNKVEYMLLADGREVRLDSIHSLDGVALQNNC